MKEKTRKTANLTEKLETGMVKPVLSLFFNTLASGTARNLGLGGQD